MAVRLNSLLKGEERFQSTESLGRMLLKRGMGNGKWGMGNGEWEIEKWGMGNLKMLRLLL